MPVRGQTLNWTNDDLDELSALYDPTSARRWWESSAQAKLGRIFESEDETSLVEEQPERSRGFVLLAASIVLPILFDVATGEFVDSTGRALRRKMIVRELHNAILDARASVLSLFDDVRTGRITLSQWQGEMQRWISDVHTTAAALGRGGFTRMSVRDLERLAVSLRFHLERLSAFTEQMQSREILLAGKAQMRAGQYIHAARGVYFQFEKIRFQERGFKQERNILAPIERHCAECPGESTKGWVKIGDLTPIGARICIMNCQCGIEYRIGPGGKIIRW